MIPIRLVPNYENPKKIFMKNIDSGLTILKQLEISFLVDILKHFLIWV